MKTAYQFDISHSDDTQGLEEIRSRIHADDTLDSNEKYELLCAVDRKLAQLAYQATQLARV
jgi:hypothetical protein